jgi:hypothetical protein
MRKVAQRELGKYSAALQLALDNYSSRLRNWTSAAIDEVERQYLAYAQELQMQAQRLATGSKSEVGESELRLDIGSLEELVRTTDLRTAS